MKSIVQFVNMQEGFLRGLGGDVKDVVTFLGLGDQLKALFGNSKQALPIIDSRIKDINYFIKQNKFKGHTDTVGWIKFLNEFIYWRLYFILDDSSYKDMCNRIKAGTMSKIIIDFETAKRQIKNIYNAKSNDDLLKVTDLYVKRCHDVYDLCIKNKIPENIMSNIFSIFTYGSMDLEILIRKVIRYNE
jgi:hypothetical protein